MNTTVNLHSSVKTLQNDCSELKHCINPEQERELEEVIMVELKTKCWYMVTNHNIGRLTINKVIYSVGETQN